MSQSGGGRAARSGAGLERMVEGLLMSHGYGKIPAKDLKGHVRAGEPVFVRQAIIGKSIYNTKLKVDFYVFHPTIHPEGLIIECKWQQAAGTVDEKYPYLVANLLITGMKSIVLLDGGGYRPGAKTWLKAQSQKANTLSIFSIKEFVTWANNGGL